MYMWQEGASHVCACEESGTSGTKYLKNIKQYKMWHKYTKYKG